VPGTQSMVVRRFLSRIAALVFAAAAAALPGAAPRAEEVVVAVGEWPPFVGAELPGYGTHARLVRERLEAAGFTVRFAFLPWSRAFNDTKAGRYAATFPWVRTDERAEDFRISERPLGADTTIGFYDGARFPDGIRAGSMEEMIAAGLRLAIQQGYWMDDHLTERGLPFQRVNRAEIGWNLIRVGRADVYIDNAEVGAVEGARFLAGTAVELRTTAPLRTDVLRILFSRSHPVAERAAAAWDAPE